jgi:hypothetical protein
MQPHPHLHEDLRAAAKALLDELNRNAASGLITRQALVLMGRLQQLLGER